MKPIESNELMDMTNILNQYIDRKKPNARRLLSKMSGPPLVIDLQPKRPKSTFKSYQTLQIKSRLPQQRALSKQRRQTKQSKEKQQSVQTIISKQTRNHQSFRILKPRSRIPSQMPPLGHKRHYLSVQQSKASQKMIRQRYWIQQTLKRGLNSTVYRCMDSLKQTQIALKMFHSVSQTNELKLLRYLDHPNLIKYQNYFISEQKLYFTMQYYPFNLLQFVTNNSSKPNKQVLKDIFRQICDGIQHLHSSDHSHCNLKLEHILFKKDKQRIKIVIVDFNNLTYSKDNEKVIRRQLIRNPNYAAPQLLDNKPYQLKPVDCWALGVILYALLNGRLPFRSKQQPELQRKIIRGKLCFSEDVSEEQRQLIESILNINPNQRLNIKQILRSEWLN